MKKKIRLMAKNKPGVGTRIVAQMINAFLENYGKLTPSTPHKKHKMGSNCMQ